MKRHQFGLIVAGILIGVLPGYLLGHSMAQMGRSPSELQDEEFSQEKDSQPPTSTDSSVPTTGGECALAVSRAPTRDGASVMLRYCLKHFPDFLDSE